MAEFVQFYSYIVFHILTNSVITQAVYHQNHNSIDKGKCCSYVGLVLSGPTREVHKVRYAISQFTHWDPVP